MIAYKLEFKEHVGAGQYLLREYKFKKETEANAKILEIDKEMKQKHRKYKLTLTKITIIKEVVLDYESN